MLYPVLVLTNRILIVKYCRFGASLVAMLRVIALGRHHMVMSGFYDFRLVALSVAVAMLASFAALDLAGRITASDRKSRVFWLWGGATALGLGIWTMHYVGMLAYRMPMPVWYHVPTVIVSLMAAIAASAIALFTVSRPSMSVWQTILGGVTMGSGIAAMHYIGMAAMRMPATTFYNSLRVGVSIILAVCISFVALILSFRARDEKHASFRKVTSALVMGSAVPVMHYTGMWAASFVRSNAQVTTSRSISISSLGITVIITSTVLVLCLVIVSSFLDRLLSAQKALTDNARKAETYFRSLAEAIPTIIWTARPDGFVDFHNKRWHDYTGRRGNGIGTGEDWQNVLHPDDLSISRERWRSAVEKSETYEAEYRMRRGSDGAYRWHLVRAVPVLGPQGAIDKWFGTCTDIDDQKRNQETLEAEVRNRTQELVEVNQRLTLEMEEREKTQVMLNRQTEQLVMELTRQSKTSSLLTKMGDLLHACSTVQEALSIVLGYAPKVFPALGGAVILLNSSRNLLEVVGSWDPYQLSTVMFEPNGCWALRTGHRYLVEAGDKSAPCSHAEHVSVSYVCIPIQAHGESLGVIHFQAANDAAQVTEQDLALSATFAEQIGLSIANIRLREALRNQSIRDALTGLFNRRYLEETFERELHRAIRTNQPLSVMMFDLDHFKRFNDTHGHDAGDAVLQNVGTFLLRNIRADDIACRYGGEEFVLIFPNSSSSSAQMRAEHLRAALTQFNVLHQGKPLGPITISVGIAEYPHHGATASQLMAEADGALYRAKKAGRDRVVVAEGILTRVDNE
jgi:diguanylate cyclase (GGDEF)-like protein/PAS domain S-box-containing protein